MLSVSLAHHGPSWPGFFRFTEMALSKSFDVPDGPRHMMAGAVGGILGSFVAWCVLRVFQGIFVISLSHLLTFCCFESHFFLFFGFLFLVIRIADIYSFQKNTPTYNEGVVGVEGVFFGYFGPLQR